MDVRQMFWPLLGPGSGVIGVALSLLSDATSPCIGCGASPEDPAEVIAASLSQVADGLRTSVYLGVLASFFLFWFIGYLWGFLRNAEKDLPWIPAVALAGGLVAGTLGLLRYGFFLGAANFGGDPHVAKAFFVLEWEYAFTVAAPVAALVGATSLIGFRRKALPPWISLLGVLVVIFALAPVAPGAGAFAGFVWLALLTLVLLWHEFVGARGKSDVCL